MPSNSVSSFWCVAFRRRRHSLASPTFSLQNFIEEEKEKDIERGWKKGRGETGGGGGEATEVVSSFSSPLLHAGLGSGIRAREQEEGGDGGGESIEYCESPTRVFAQVQDPFLSVLVYIYIHIYVY